ncbi:hypothetical protein, partial [Rathayibacter rathayi]|uniref:hypothetical protein n=1 Tax=Rathayibacter rathayi TaxID=33887 RepID=UPI001CA46FA5
RRNLHHRKTSTPLPATTRRPHTRTTTPSTAKSRATTVTLVLRTEAFDHTGRPCFTIALDDHN